METEALETTTERLEKSRWELLEYNERNSANIKGKAKATELDDEKEAEFRRKLEDIDKAILVIRDVGQDNIYKTTRQSLYASCNHDAGPMSTNSSYKNGITLNKDDDKEAIWNPFTNSYAYRETGLEPGPSSLGGDSRQPPQNPKQEWEVRTDSSLRRRDNLADPMPLWMRYSEQPQHEASKHVPQNTVELNGGNRPLRADPFRDTELREAAVHSLNSRDSPKSRTSLGKLAFVGNIVKSCSRWLFGFKHAANDTNQGSPSRNKSPSQLDSPGSSRAAITSLGTELTPASSALTETPESPEDKNFLLALALEEEEKAKTIEYELSRRLAIKLQLQEDRELAESQEMLEKEWLQEGHRLKEAALETERRAAAETKSLQRMFQAQDIISQADAELAARLNGLSRAIQFDREIAEQLQAEMDREAVAEDSSTPLEVGLLYGRSPTDQVRNRTQQLQSQVSDDRAFAQILQEQEVKRAAKEEEETLSEIRAWQKKAEQGADRRQRGARTVPSIRNTFPHAQTTQPDHAQASHGLQAVPRTVPASHDLNDESECSLCTESFPTAQLVRPCEHFYCRGCLAGKTVPMSFPDSG